MRDNLDDEIKKEIQAIRERIRSEAGLDLPAESSTVIGRSVPLEETGLASSSGKASGWRFLLSVGAWIAGVVQAPWARSRRLLKNRKGSGPESRSSSADQSGAKISTSSNNPKRLKLTKKQAILSSGTAVMVSIVILGILNFSFVTVNEGIETTLGSSENRTVFMLNADNAERADLVVAVLRRAGADGADLLVLGTVFSKNDETYALFDGKVIWQIPLGNIRGKVLFAKATQTP